MQRIRLLLLSAFIIGLPLAVFAQETTSTLAFTHVTVIDCTGAPSRPDMTVIVNGDRIAAIGKAADINVPKDAIIIESSHKFMIPGLWDMHTHVRPYEEPLFVANGVTGVRIMFGRPRDIEARRHVRNRQTFIPDRNVACAPLADESFDFRMDRDVIRVTTEAEARKAVSVGKKIGFDSIKISSLLRRDLYIAVADEAKRVEIPFAGHVPESVTAEFASEQGQKSMEHLFGILIGCSRLADELQKRYSDTSAGENRIEIRKRAIETYDETIAKRLFAKFVKNETWQCPTLTLFYARAHADDPLLFQDSRLEFTPNWESSRWNRDLKRQAPHAQFLKTELQHRLRIVGAMHKAGVRILAGTDTANPYCFQGFGLHDELELLVRAGLPPLAALQSATRNPAEYIGRLDERGTIEAGKIADLVLLEKDPLEDIRNTRRISGVVLRGRWLEKEKLRQMLSQAKLTTKIEDMGGRCKRDTSKAHLPVVEARVANQRITDEQVALLRDFTELNHLGLSFSQVSDDGLGVVTEFPQLQHLFLNRTKITGAGLQHLRSLHNLRSLQLADTSIGNDDLVYLEQLKNIRQLVLTSTKITDDGLKSIAMLGTVEDLSLSKTAIGDRGIGNLRSLSGLTSLRLDQTRVSNAGLQFFQKMPDLKFVGIGDTNVSDEGLAHLAKLSELESLGVAANRITDKGLGHLANLRNLKWLNLSHTKVTDDGLNHLSSLTKLRNLILNGTLVSKAGVERLKQKLPDLDVTYSPYGQLTVAVAQSSDDAEERSSGQLFVQSLDLEIVRDLDVQSADTGDQSIGLRFGKINIPRNARLKKAYVQFTAREADDEPTNLTIGAEMTLNAATFRSTQANITKRKKTPNLINWSPAAWLKPGAQGASQRTPDLRPLIKAVMSQTGWERGNSLVLIIEGTGRRVAETYDSNPAAAPTLHIEYEMQD